MPRTPQEMVKLVDDAWDLYRKDRRVKESVDLYAAGFAFGEPHVERLLADKDPEAIPVDCERGALLGIGRDLYVAGVAGFGAHVDPQGVHITGGNGSIAIHQTLPYGDAPPGELWKVAVNHDLLLGALARPGLTAHWPPQTLERCYRSLGIPTALLSPDTASECGANETANALVALYRPCVNEMKQDFSMALEAELEKQVGGVCVSWDPPWVPELGLEGLPDALHMGHVYQVFRQQGVELVGLRQGVEALLAEQRLSQSICQQAVAGITSTFGT